MEHAERILRGPSLRVELIHSEAVLPIRAHTGDAGYDLAACTTVRLPKGFAQLVPTGVRVQLPPNYYARIVGRSSALKRGLRVDESIIDNGWRGDLYIWVTALHQDAQVERGDRIAQLIPMPLIALPITIVEGITGESEDGRNSEGFGSTGGWGSVAPTTEYK